MMLLCIVVVSIPASASHLRVKSNRVGVRIRNTPHGVLVSLPGLRKESGGGTSVSDLLTAGSQQEGGEELDWY